MHICPHCVAGAALAAAGAYQFRYALYASLKAHTGTIASALVTGALTFALVSYAALNGSQAI